LPYIYIVWWEKPHQTLKTKIKEQRILGYIHVGIIVVFVMTIYAAIGLELDQNLAINPLLSVLLTIAVWLFFIALLLYAGKKRLATLLFKIGPAIIIIVTVITSVNTVNVFNKIVEENAIRIQELAAKYEQCIYETESMEILVSQLLDWYEYASKLYGSVPETQLLRNPLTYLCEPLLEEIKDDPIIKELYKMRSSRIYAIETLAFFLFLYAVIVFIARI
jgi:hypothetical protein